MTAPASRKPVPDPILVRLDRWAELSVVSGEYDGDEMVVLAFDSPDSPSAPPIFETNLTIADALALARQLVAVADELRGVDQASYNPEIGPGSFSAAF